MFTRGSVMDQLIVATSSSAKPSASTLAIGDGPPVIFAKRFLPIPWRLILLRQILSGQRITEKPDLHAKFG